MAVSNPAVPNLHLAAEPSASFYEKLNTTWHERSLQIFMAIVLAHWMEHLVQAYQIWVMHWPRPKALGLLGLFWPWLIQTEALHYGYALIMLIGIWVLRKGFTGRALTWWTIALVIQFWHHVEHFLLIYQATTHHNFWHKPVPCSVLQLYFPRVELHLFYNTVVFIPMVIGMYYHMFPPANEQGNPNCTCEWGREDDVKAAVAA
jgi:hypothetical protein